MGPLELFARPFLLLLIFHKEILLGVVRFCNFKRTSTKIRNLEKEKKRKRKYGVDKKSILPIITIFFIHLTPQTETHRVVVCTSFS